jgi:hypothetical protein
MLIAFFYRVWCQRGEVFGMQCQLALYQFVAARVATDRDPGRDEKLLEPSNKPFILGLADEIFGLRARFFIWLALRPTRLSFELEEIVVRWPDG